MSRFLDTSTTTQLVEILVQNWRPSCSCWATSVWSPTCRITVGKTIWINFNWDRDVKKYRIGNVDLCIESKVCSCLYTWTISKWLKESKIWILCGRNWWNWLIWENRNRFLTTCSCDASNVNANRTKVLLMNTEKCSNHEFLQEQQKSYLDGRNRTRMRSRCLMTWKVLRRNAWKDIANWRINRLSNCIRSLHHVLTTITSERKN